MRREKAPPERYNRRFDDTHDDDDGDDDQAKDVVGIKKTLLWLMIRIRSQRA
jgi:hypothetical protein